MGFGKFREAAQKCVRHARQHDENARRKEVQAKQREIETRLNAARKAAINDPLHEIPESVTVTTEYLNDVQKRLYYNDDFANHYIRLADEYNMPKLYNTAMNIKNCHKHWFGDWYGLCRVFDRKSLSLCHNKFCSNCAHLRQASRLKRFTPIFEDLQKTYDLYHCVMTIPNCSGSDLNGELDTFTGSSKKVVRYFRGNAKIRGLDFSQYGFVGALRNLEIVVNPDDYHAHYHFIFVLKKDLPLYKTIVNAFSFKRGAPVRKFSELEILIQKILYLAHNGQKITLDAIDSLPLGYSCTLDKIEGDEWHECLKYVTKLTKDTMTALDYEQFKTLYFALDGRRVMQGFGILYRLAKDDSIDEEAAAEYERIIAELQLVEDPISTHYELDTLVDDVKNGYVRVISKYIIQQLLNKESQEGENDR